jgi:hypothetical protein
MVQYFGGNSPDTPSPSMPVKLRLATFARRSSSVTVTTEADDGRLVLVRPITDETAHEGILPGRPMLQWSFVR